MFGTPEEGFRDGLKADIRRTRTVIHLWGGALLAALAASGALDGRAAKVIGAFLGGLGG